MQLSLLIYFRVEWHVAEGQALALPLSGKLHCATVTGEVCVYSLIVMFYY